MSEDERALERREHQLRAMNNGHVITIMPGSKEEMRAQLDSLIEFEHEIHDERTEFFNQFRDDDTPSRPPSLCLLTEADIDHLLEHGYIPGLDIVLLTEPLINDNSISLRPHLSWSLWGMPMSGKHRLSHQIRYITPHDNLGCRLGKRTLR